MRFRVPVIAVVAALIVASVSVPSAAQDRRVADRGAQRELLARLDGDARVSRDRPSGEVRAIRGARGPIASARSLGDPRTPAGAARAFLGRFGPLLGVTSPSRQLRVSRVDRGSRTGTYVRYQQQIDGVPVLGGEIVVVVDGRLNVRAVRGETSRGRTVAERPSVSPGAAQAAARDAVARATGVPADRLRADRPTRWVFDPRLLDAPGLPHARLVWRTRVQDASGRIDWFVAVDARTGVPALAFDQRTTGVPATAPQRICDQQGRRESTLDRLPCTSAGALVPPYGSADAGHAEAATQATHDLYRQRFGFDLAAELGGTLVSTVRYCPRPAGGECPYGNAFWDGAQMVYGAGFASADDVVGHELTHGVTEHTSNLLYYMQSGAINEALSDIFGEAADLTHDLSFDTDTAGSRWEIGEDLPAAVGVIRDMADPTRFDHPDSVDSDLWDDDPREVDSGGVHSNSGVANHAFWLMVEGPDPLDPSPDIAMDQALAIWFLALRSLLTSASDYDDLASSLLLACDQLAGVPGGVRDGAGGPSRDIESADCAEDGPLDSAIAATHMRWDDRTRGTRPRPRCTDPDATVTPLLADAIDEAGTGWAFDAGGDARWSTSALYGFPAPGDPSAPPWHLWGQDLARTADRRLRRASGVAIPASGRPVFLWFRHAYGFDDGSEDLDPTDRRYDGGLVELSADGGAWRDVTPLYLSGAPTRRLYTGDTNPLKGRVAFGAESGGYVTARLNLWGTPALGFGGTATRVSFRLGTDSRYGGEGWYIDDVTIYTCVNAGESEPPTVGVPAVSLRPGSMTSTGRVPVTVTASVTGDGFIMGRVAVGGVSVGGTVAGERVTGSMPTGADAQSVAWTATDENGDRATQAADVRVRRLEQTDWSFGGAWRTQSGSSFSGGSARHASTAGRTASITAAGTGFALVSQTGRDRGKARVCLDGGACRTIDLYRSSASPRRLVTIWNDVHPGSHTVTVRVLGKRNPRSSGRRVDVDALVVVGG